MSEYDLTETEPEIEPVECDVPTLMGTRELKILEIEELNAIPLATYNMEWFRFQVWLQRIGRILNILKISYLIRKKYVKPTEGKDTPRRIQNDLNARCILQWILINRMADRLDMYSENGYRDYLIASDIDFRALWILMRDREDHHHLTIVKKRKAMRYVRYEKWWDNSKKFFWLNRLRVALETCLTLKLFSSLEAFISLVLESHDIGNRMHKCIMRQLDCFFELRDFIIECVFAEEKIYQR